MKFQHPFALVKLTNQAERQSKEIERFQGWGLSASFNVMAGFSPTTVTQICGVGAWSRHFRSRDATVPLSSFIGRPEESRDQPAPLCQVVRLSIPCLASHCGKTINSCRYWLTTTCIDPWNGVIPRTMHVEVSTRPAFNIINCSSDFLL